MFLGYLDLVHDVDHGVAWREGLARSGVMENLWIYQLGNDDVLLLPSLGPSLTTTCV